MADSNGNGNKAWGVTGALLGALVTSLIFTFSVVGKVPNREEFSKVKDDIADIRVSIARLEERRGTQ